MKKNQSRAMRVLLDAKNTAIASLLNDSTPGAVKGRPRLLNVLVGKGRDINFDSGIYDDFTDTVADVREEKVGDQWGIENMGGDGNAGGDDSDDRGDGG